MWIIYALIIHILLLGSIFVIYFRSPVITNLQPYKNIPLEPPAKRLVLIVTDGLRAESFYRDNLKNVPNIKHLIDTKGGIYGISKTRVPTESRPGHIALIAGLYEDPSAVAKGWKENPTDFDTVFNRSSKTYAWGANDVLHIFSRLSREDEKRLFFDSYNHELDFSGKEKSYELDKWVFNKVNKFLQRKREDLQTESHVIYFLHLLGLDTAGHVYKPNTKLFLQNLNFTDRGIREMYELFENTFPDGKTAYVLTSDHGMTNAGSHGAGANYETETPFFIWGSGVNHIAYSGNSKATTLYELEQAQMAPIMSALLGIATPMNNFGILPQDIINASESYLLHAAQGNAYQIYNQYKALLEQHEKGLLNKYLPAFKIDIDYLEWTTIQKNKTNDLAINQSYQLMSSALKGIDYYFSYYRKLLLTATTITFFAWLGYLLKLLAKLTTPTKDFRKINFSPGLNIYFYINVLLASLTLAFCLLQLLSWNITLYLILPFVVSALFLNQRGHIMLMFDSKFGMTKFHLILLLMCAELLVYTFFDRRAISIGFLLFALQDKVSKDFFKQKLKLYTSFLLSLVLCIFPLLPISVGYSNIILLYTGICMTFIRSFLVKNAITKIDKIVVFIVLLNAAISIYKHSQQLGVSIVSYFISWAYLLYVLVSLIKPCHLMLKQRLEKLLILLSCLYSMFCTSYESLFILLLITELISSLDCSKYNNNVTISSLTPCTLHISHCFRLAFKILLYTFFSFFGTGNIASVSSFDPNIMRCFLSTFSPFIIMFLVILKLIIPVLLIISIIFALSPLALQHERQIFICLLIVCDLMGLNFLFLVKNQGSWLEIGSSISHFVIMQVTTVALALFVNLAKFLLKIKSSTGFNANSGKIK